MGHRQHSLDFILIQVFWRAQVPSDTDLHYPIHHGHNLLLEDILLLRALSLLPFCGLVRLGLLGTSAVIVGHVREVCSNLVEGTKHRGVAASGTGQLCDVIIHIFGFCCECIAAYSGND